MFANGANKLLPKDALSAAAAAAAAARRRFERLSGGGEGAITWPGRPASRVSRRSAPVEGGGANGERMAAEEGAAFDGRKNGSMAEGDRGGGRTAVV